MLAVFDSFRRVIAGAKGGQLVQATLICFSAIIMWSPLALLTALSGRVPPFQLAALCFTIASFIGVVALATKDLILTGRRN